MENQFKTDFGKFSFTTIATKILNRFLMTHLDLGLSTTFKNFLRLDLSTYLIYMKDQKEFGHGVSLIA